MLKSLLLASALTMAASPIYAKNDPYAALLSNNAQSPGTTSIGMAKWQTTTPGNINWVSLPSKTVPIPSTQKTIGAAVKYGSNSAEPIAAVMYRDPANGNVNMVEPISVSGDGNYNVIQSGGNPVSLNSGNPFTNALEEIEIDPISGDIFALAVSGSSRQIYRIDRASNTASVMTLWTNTTTPSPNGNKIYGNVFTGGYKNGSIAFVPNPQNPNEFLLAFTHESTIARYQLCTWYFKPDGLKLVGGPGSMNRCWGINTNTGITIPGMPLLSTILPGTGLNTAYAEGKFIIARDNGPLRKLDWSAFNPGQNGTPSDSVKPLNDDLSSTGPMNMSSDLTYWKRF